MSAATAEPPISKTAAEREIETGVALRDRLAMSPFHLALLFGFCVFFLYHNYAPIFHSDVWGHVAYGDWILRHGRLPSEEPFVHLAEGVPVVDTAWLGQVLLAAAVQFGEPEWLAHVFALSALGTYLLLTSAYYHQTRRIGVAVLSAVLVFVAGFSRHAIVRPECFGTLCFAAVIWAVVRADARADRRPESCTYERANQPFPRWTWFAVPALFCLWANLHGSFIVGLALLGCYAMGRALEVLWETGEPWRIVRDGGVLRWSWLLELSVLATLANPLGMDLLVQTVMFPAHPNLKVIVEWYPLKMVSLEGIPMAASWLFTAVMLRLSKARLTPGDVLLLLVFNTAVCLRVRMVAWYGPVLLLVFAPHLADVLQRLAAAPAWKTWREELVPLFRRSPRVSLVAGLIVWMTFCFSPISRPVLGGKQRPDHQIFSRDTPLGATAYLREHPPQGQVFAPQWWGDWLVWFGPPDLQVMMTTNAVHVAPPRVWNDYLEISAGIGDIERRLDRYRINTIVVSKALQPELPRIVERLGGWKVVFDDEISLIAVRENSRESATAARSAAAEVKALE